MFYYRFMRSKKNSLNKLNETLTPNQFVIKQQKKISKIYLLLLIAFEMITES